MPKDVSRVIVIHGSFGSPDGNWFPWLQHEVEILGDIAVVPKFPTPEGQNLLAWKEVFDSEVGALTPESILVGHSLGAGFLLSLLEVSAVPIRAAFLVAGFLGTLDLPNYDTINKSFVCKEFDWQRIKENVKSITVMAGDNDPYVPNEKGTELAALLGVPLEVIPGGGHLNAEFGYTSFPFLLEKMRHYLSE